MIGATIAERSEPDNLRASRSDASGLTQELLEPLLEERFREAAKDAVLQICARRAVRTPHTEVDAHQPATPIREGIAHVLRGAAHGRLGHEERELVGELPGCQANLA